MIRKLFVLRC